MKKREKPKPKPVEKDWSDIVWSEPIPLALLIEQEADNEKPIH